MHLIDRRERMHAETRLNELGLTLPPPPAPVGNYVPFRIGGGLLFLSGVGPRHDDGTSTTGKVGSAISIDEGYRAARQCGLNLLTNMRVALGSLDRVDTIMKVVGMVNALPGFTEHTRVINGCTDLFVEVFGDSGRPARSAVGMSSLPTDIAVEIEAIVLIRT
jgi:enamine deaminase RidA (YjgF/YER057c/UK114 family)